MIFANIAGMRMARNTFCRYGCRLDLYQTLERAICGVLSPSLCHLLRNLPVSRFLRDGTSQRGVGDRSGGVAAVSRSRRD